MKYNPAWGQILSHRCLAPCSISINPSNLLLGAMLLPACREGRDGLLWKGHPQSGKWQSPLVA